MQGERVSDARTVRGDDPANWTLHAQFVRSRGKRRIVASTGQATGHVGVAKQSKLSEARRVLDTES